MQNKFKERKQNFYRRYKRNENKIDNKKETDLNSLLGNIVKGSDIETKTIICIVQKQSLQEKTFGVCHCELPHGMEIYTGDYSLSEIDSFELFISYLQPDTILLNCPVDSKLSEIFKGENFESRVKYIQYTNVQYNQLSDLLQVYFQSQNEEANKVNIYAKVSEILDNLSTCSLSAMYTMLNIALKSTPNNYSGSLMKFNRIEFQELVFVSKKTQREIKIFEEKLHPSLVKGKGKSKEGFSLFSVFNKCITTQGKKLMRSFFQFPLQNLGKLTQRYDCIKDFLNLKNYATVKMLLNEMKSVRDLEKILSELGRFMINFKIWNGIFTSFGSILKIFQIFRSQMIHTSELKFKLLNNIFTRINLENIEKIFDFLCNCLEFPKEELKPKIKSGLNEDLDSLRTEFCNLDEVLSRNAIEYSKLIPKDSFMEKFMFVFLPQLGYMLGVEKTEKYKKYLANLLKRPSSHFKEEISSSQKESKRKDLILPTLSEDLVTFNNIIKEDKAENDLEEIVEEEEEQNKILDSDSDADDLIDLTNSEETELLQEIKIEGLKINFQFHSDDMIYFKNEITATLDAQYGDLSARITDIENAIFREISKQILEFEKDILLTNEFIAHLDIFLQYYLITEKLNLNPPEFNKDSTPKQNINKKLSIILLTETKQQNKGKDNPCRFSFTEGRNLITEFTSDQRYIKNSFDSKGKSIHIITGQVSSGKSVFLKMIGMLVYLAQSGCYVPARNFSLEVYNKILTNIEIFESSLDHMSGFTLEIKEIKIILDQLEKDLGSSRTGNDFKASSDETNCLVLLDDPFKRSSAHNKNCLLAGFLDHLTRLIKNKPQTANVTVFITTSYESVNFLTRHKIIDESIASIYEMKSEVLNTDKILNLYEVKQCAINKDTREDCPNMKLFLAKEKGLDNQLFLRSLEISNLLHSNQKIFPYITKVSRIVDNLKCQKHLLKVYDNISDELIDKINNIMNL